MEEGGGGGGATAHNFFEYLNYIFYCNILTDSVL